MTVQDAPARKGPSDPAASALDPLRRRAIEAMAASVAERGYARTTVADVLRLAGMSRRTFYRIYQNREECFLDTYAVVSDEALAHITRSSGPGSGECEGIEEPLRAVLEYLASRPAHAHVLVTEPVSAGGQSVERHAATLGAFRDRLQPVLVAGGGSDRMASTAAVGAVYHVIQRHLWDGEASDLPALAPDLARLVGRLAA